MEVIFLDRDGVINENISGDYVRGIKDFLWIPRSLQAIRMLTEAGYTLFIVTNQACIGKGLISRRVMDHLHAWMMQTITEHGGKIEKIYTCPHRIDENCSCRKPNVGLLQTAAAEYDIHLKKSYFIGDSSTDMEAASHIGAYSILVLTGRGNDCRLQVEASGHANHISYDLYDAANHIISGGNS